MLESTRLDTNFVDSVMGNTSSLRRVKFIRLDADTAVGSLDDLHRRIAQDAGLSLLYEIDESKRRRRVYFGAHDHGHISFDPRGVAVYIYGKSTDLEFYDSSNKLVRRPEIRFIAGATPEQRQQIIQEDGESFRRYAEELNMARMATCRIIAPLFISVINNPQIYWSLNINEDGSGSPPNDGLALYLAS